MSDQYVSTTTCDQKHGELVGLLQNINDRLYKDNGTKSIQSRLNEHEQTMSNVLAAQTNFNAQLTRLFWTLFTLLLGGAGWCCKEVVLNWLSKGH